MISCTQAINQLWEYLDGTVEPSDRAALEGHLARCRRCCGELEFAKELRGFLASADRGQVPADVLERLNRTLEGLGR